MLRRVLASVLGLVLSLVVMGLVARGHARSPRQPDVVMIAIDTLRSDHVHCFGNDWIRTPNLDALARDGVRFSRCCATAPWTLPSFASIFTGLTPSHHGTVGGGREVLDDRFTTLAEHLAGAGYRTYGYATVKWLTPPFGMAQGFNFDLPVEAPAGLEGGALVTAMGQATFDLPRDKPLFTFLHYFDAHAPYAPPPPFAHMYYQGDERAPGAPPVLEFLRSSANAAPNRANGIYDWLDGVTDLQFPAREYAAGVSYADDHVGRIVAELKRHKRYDDTLIIVVADHGEHLGEHDIWFTHTLPYQETLHVPLIIKLPRGHAAGRLIDRPVSTLDLLPTVLDWLGLPAAKSDGRSLRDLVEGRDQGQASLLVAEQGAEPDELSKTLIDWPWKLILFRSPAGDRYELYDLGGDPGERRDLAAQRPRELARLSARLWTLFEEQHPLGFGAASGPANLDAAAQRQLRSLGYLAGRAARAPAAPDAPGSDPGPAGAARRTGD